MGDEQGTSQRRRRTIRAAFLLAVGAATGVLQVGCGRVSGPGQPGRAGSPATDLAPSSTQPAFGWFAPAGGSAGDGTTVSGENGVPGPVDALERADLRWPDHADVRQVETQTFTGFAESYLFVFRVPEPEAVEFCSQGGLGGVRPAHAVPGTVTEALGQPVVSQASRWCAGTAPTDARWGRYVLIDPGDPASVHLLLQRRP